MMVYMLDAVVQKCLFASLHVWQKRGGNLTSPENLVHNYDIAIVALPAFVHHHPGTEHGTVLPVAGPTDCDRHRLA